MRGNDFSGEYPIAVLNFLSRFRDACDSNAVSEDAAVWYIKSFLTDQAESLVNSSLTISHAKDSRRSDMIRNFPEVVSHLFRLYATDEAIAEAHAEL